MYKSITKLKNLIVIELIILRENFKFIKKILIVIIIFAWIQSQSIIQPILKISDNNVKLTFWWVKIQISEINFHNKRERKWDDKRKRKYYDKNKLQESNLEYNGLTVLCRMYKRI